MFKKADDMIREIKEKMRGGNGEVEITHIFMQDELKGKARLIAKLTLNENCSIGLHEHVNEEEIFYIINGIGKVNDNGKSYEVKKGDTVLTGNGASHSIENVGKEPLEIVAVILLY